MTILLHHHPFSRAANTVWILEEVGVPYELRHWDIMKGEHKSPELLKINPMGKLPTIIDGDVVVTEQAAIGMYLADRYAPNKLAPPLDSPERGTYLRWIVFGPSVIEPGTMAKQGKWEFRPGAAGWGDYDAMMKAINYAIEGRDFVLGSKFSMADVLFGGTIRFMLGFKMIEPTPVLTAYAERLAQRPALQRAEAKNKEEMEKYGIKMPG